MDTWFSKKILKWYQNNERNLPWRNQKDPYKIWLSEIILQQTQVNQGLDYYNRFVAKYPNVTKLAKAPQDEVLKLWEGLGYYSRARNLHESAKIIVSDYNAIFPRSHSEIKALKGIGDYTAAAIASFAFDLPYAVVDGNVYRLLSRVFGIRTAIDTSPAKKVFFTLAQSLLDKKKPATHNQAIMEFGSQYCKPVNPNCACCIFSDKCFAFNNNLVSQLPLKLKKTKIKDRYFNYLVIVDKSGNVLINKRSNNDIWKGLYEFCLLETKSAASLPQVLNEINVKNLLKSHFGIKHASKTYKHVLSHQHLHTTFYVITVSRNFMPSQTKVNLNAIKKIAFPRLISKFLNEYDLKKIL